MLMRWPLPRAQGPVRANRFLLSPDPQNNKDKDIEVGLGEKEWNLRGPDEFLHSLSNSWAVRAKHSIFDAPGHMKESDCQRNSLLVPDSISILSPHQPCNGQARVSAKTESFSAVRLIEGRDRDDLRGVNLLDVYWAIVRKPIRRIRTRALAQYTSYFSLLFL